MPKSDKNNPEDKVVAQPLNIDTVHRIFGSLFAVWIGYIFTRRFPQNDVELIYPFAFISLLCILLYVCFSRYSGRQRLVAYVILFISSYIMIPAFYKWGISAYPSNNPIKISEIVFLNLTIFFWCISVEGSNIIRKWLKKYNVMTK